MQTVNFKIFTPKTNELVLDLGCGEGRHSIGAYMLHDADIVAADLSFKDLNTAQERFKEFDQQSTNRSLNIIQADALSLPFADKTFDKIICSEVLEHIPNYKSVLQEIFRTLKPGGDLAISVPSYFPEKICWLLSDDYHQVEGGHIRIFSSKPLQKNIENIGFVCYRKHKAHALHSPYWWLKCLFWQKDNMKIVELYHKFLIWDLIKKPWITRFLDQLLNPLIGKSVVMYFRKGL